MPRVSKPNVDYLLTKYGAEDIRDCPAITIHDDGSADIDDRSQAYIALVGRHRATQITVTAKPTPPRNTAEWLLNARNATVAAGPVVPSYRPVNPPVPSAEVWGPRLWAEMYRWAISYKGDAEASRKFFDGTASRIPCGDCQGHHLADLASHPLDFSDRDTLFASISEMHNRVNARTGKPQLSLADARSRWGLDEPASPPGDYFGMSRVISLRRTPERLAQLWRDWPMDWPFERPEVFNALDGESEAIPATWRAGRGAWGLIWSCIDLLRLYIASGTSKPLLVLEDDCQWMTDAIPELTRFIARLPADFDAAFPGPQHLAETVPAGKNIVRAMGAHRMHCMIVARKYADTLLKVWEAWAASETSLPQDHALTAESPRRRFYAAEPALCGQRANYSTLANQYFPDRSGGEWQGMQSGFFRPDQDRERYDKSYPLRCGGTKRHIDVGERDAFNGASIDTPQGRLLVFRGNALGTIKYRWMDSPEVAQLPLICNDDPRLAWHHGRLYLSTNFWWGRWAGGQMELREVMIGDDRKLSLRDVGKFITIENWPGYQKPAHEKNWVPFSHGGNLLYIYSINPHRVLEVDLFAGRVKLIHQSTLDAIAWPIVDGSELRCSAPPVLMADGEYLSTFHVRREKDYWTGFYTFDAATFRVTRMSREPVLWPEDSDGVCWRNGDMRLLFIQSMEIDGDTITLAGGDNDHSVMMATIPLSTILATLP